MTCRWAAGAPGRSPAQAQPCCLGLWLLGGPGPLRTQDPSCILRNSPSPEDPSGLELLCSLP